MKGGIEILGIKELMQDLEDIGERQTKNVMRSSVHGLASKTAKKIKAKAPVNTVFDEVTSNGKTTKRKGVLKNAIKAQRRRPKNGMFISDVRITEGKSAKYDAWYWHFVEYGTRKIKGQNFVEPAKAEAKATSKNLLKSEFQKRVIKKLQKAAK